MKLPWTHNRYFLTGLSLGGMFALYLLYSLSHYDPDFGWHLQAGRFIMSHGVPAHDIFTYTARSFPWIDHEWFSDVLVADLFRLGGYAAVAVVFAGLWTAALGLASRRRGVVLWLAALATLPYCGVRTVTWSVLFVVLLEKLLSSRRYWLIVPLFGLWANLHGSFILGLALLAIEVARQRTLAPVWVASAAATLINPYGPRLYTEIFRTLFDPGLHSAIQEWRPLSFPWQSWPFWILFLAVIIVYRPVRANRAAIWTALLGVMALASTRHTPLFAVAAIPVFEQAAGQLRNDFRQTKLGSRLLWFAALLAVIPLTAEAAGGGFNLSPNSGYPAAAAAYLRQHPCPGSTFNTYNEGGYLIWKLGQPDYIDGRMPSWKQNGTSYLEQYWAFVSNPSSRAAQEARYGILCAVIPTGKVPAKGGLYDLSASFQHQGWRRVYSDRSFQVWER